jgi:hypothetical protein
MLTFSTVLYSPAGVEIPFAITATNAGHSLEGEMRWGESLVPLRQIHARANENSLYCSAKWPSDYTRTWIVVSAEDGIYRLSIRILGNPFDYTATAEGYDKFKVFLREVEALKDVPPMPDGLSEAGFDLMLEQAAPKFKFAYLYAGSNIYKHLPVRFTSCTVNDLGISVSSPGRLPNDLGIFVPLGPYPLGDILHIRWTFEVDMVSGRPELALGAYKNSLADRKFFEKYALEPFQSYRGSADLAI